MRRRELLAAGVAPAFAQLPAGDYRNVILLIGDDHSPIAGCYGNKVVQTPNLDRLANQGVRFTQSFCTTASCSASRSVLLTGLLNHSNGQFGHAHQPYNFHTHDHVASVPKLAKAKGAVTGVIGKLHVIPPAVYPWDYQSPGNPTGGSRDVYGMAQEAAAFFRQTNGRPFYLHVGYSDPHRAAKGFANEATYPNVKKRVYSPADVIVPPFLPDRPEVRAELAEYYQAIDRMDQGIGFLLEALDKSGRAKDTLIIYLGDNGLPFPGAKASCYDTGLSVPLIISGPGIKGVGAPNDTLVAWTDIAPTVLDWMRVPGPDYPLHGKSLVPMLFEDRPFGRDEILFSHTFHELSNYYPFRGIRTRKYKYIRFLYPELTMPLPSDLFASPTWQGIQSRKDASMGVRQTESVFHHSAEELYDVEADPYETRNLAGSERVAKTLPELRGKVISMRQATKDPWFVPGQGLG